MGAVTFPYLNPSGRVWDGQSSDQGICIAKRLCFID